MEAMASQITSVSTVCSNVCSGADQRKRQIPLHWPLWGEFTSDRWIPLTKTSDVENLSIRWRHHMCLGPVLTFLGVLQSLFLGFKAAQGFHMNCKWKQLNCSNHISENVLKIVVWTNEFSMSWSTITLQNNKYFKAIQWFFKYTCPFPKIIIL